MASIKGASGAGSGAFAVALMIIDYRFPTAEPWLSGILLILFVILVTVFVMSLFHARAARDDKEGPQIHIHNHFADQIREQVPSLSANSPVPAVVVTPRAGELLPPITGQMHAIEDSDTTAAAGTVFPPTVRMISNLYVGQVIISAANLEAESPSIEIAVRAFNGYSETIRFLRVEGVIQATINGENEAPLSPPTWRSESSAQPIPPGAEFMVVMDQSVSTGIAADWLSALKQDSWIGLNFRDLKVWVEAEDAPQLRSPLPMWHGATMRRRDDIFTGRWHIIELQGASITVTAGAVR